MNRVRVFILSALTLISLPAFGQKTVNGRYGFAQFASDSARTLVEFYYEIPKSGLTFRTVDNMRQSASVMCRLHAEQWGVVRGNEEWHVATTITHAEDTNRNMLGVHQLILQPGDYQLHVEVIDSGLQERRDTFTLSYRVRAFPTTSIAMSSIQLGRTMRYVSAAEYSPFVKGGIEIIPNVRSVYDDASLSLVYYTEVYNLNLLSGQDSLFIATEIVNSDGTPMYQRVSAKAHPGPAIAVADSMSIDALMSGRYYLTIRAITAHHGTAKAETTAARCDFTVNNSALPGFADPLDAQDAASSEFSDKNEGALDTMFMQCSFIATKQERTVFAGLAGAAAKMDFLFHFWETRNRQGGKYTLKSYHEALDYAALNFKSMGKPGWRSDRGRVYLQYGPPSTSPEKHLFEVDSKPYEVWFYDNVEGGVRFYFVDVGGYGDFKLVHSTEQFELHDEGWQNRYAKNLMKGQ